MRISLDDAEFKKLQRDAHESPAQTMRRVVQTLKAVSFAVEKRIKRGMPVDTGRARASWGHWTPADLRSFVGLMDANPGDAVWRESDGGLTIEQGTNVPYVEGLNQGHSRQAPAGFIDSAQLQGQVTLETQLGLIDPLAPGGEWLALAGVNL